MSAGVSLAQEMANNEETLQLLVTQGQTVYMDNCAACHGNDGEGGGGPKLDGNSFLKSRPAVINQILFGAQAHGMPPFAPVLSDVEVAAVSTYIRNAWKNEFGIVLPRSVELRRNTEAAQ